jgi:hypothetical protein
MAVRGGLRLQLFKNLNCAANAKDGVAEILTPLLQESHLLLAAFELLFKLIKPIIYRRGFHDFPRCD